MWESNKEQAVEEDRFIRWKGDNEKEVFYFLEGHNDISTEGKNFYIDFEGVATCHVGNLILKNGNKKVDVGDYILRMENGFLIVDTDFLKKINELEHFKMRSDVNELLAKMFVDYYYGDM